jgi:hypothetical protein
MELYALFHAGLCDSHIAQPTASSCFSDPYDIESHALLTLAESVREVWSATACRHAPKLEASTARNGRYTEYVKTNQ